MILGRNPQLFSLVRVDALSINYSALENPTSEPLYFSRHFYGTMKPISIYITCIKKSVLFKNIPFFVLIFKIDFLNQLLRRAKVFEFHKFWISADESGFHSFPVRIYQSSECFYLVAGFIRKVLQRKYTPLGAEMACFLFFVFSWKGWSSSWNFTNLKGKVAMPTCINGQLP